MSQIAKAWFVYILKCADDTLYTGITTDPERRTREHNQAKKGARYTRAKRPVRLVYHELAENRSDASRREWEIKQLSRAAKLALICTAGRAEGKVMKDNIEVDNPEIDNIETGNTETDNTETDNTEANDE